VPEFRAGQAVVYPAHGVGRVVRTERFDYGGRRVPFLRVRFEEERFDLRLRVESLASSPLRPISSRATMRRAMDELRETRTRRRSAMWSRRAQEYDSSIQSGDPIRIAKVVRELWRGKGQPEQSFSERQMYQVALSRLARELAAVDDSSEESAAAKIERAMRSES